MTHQPQRRLATGFSLVELLMVIAVVTLLISLLLPALSKIRRTGRLAVCVSNLRQFGSGIATYSVDFRDSLATFTWQPNEGPYDSPFVDLKDSVPSAETAVRRQAVNLIRLMSGIDEYGDEPHWAPTLNYTNLVLERYLGQSLNAAAYACPEHAELLRCKRARNANPADPLSVEPDFPEYIANWGYGSSYGVTVGYYSNDHAVGQIVQSLGPYWGQSVTYCRGVPASRNFLGRRRLTEVSFPSQKVAALDHADRHTKPKSLAFLYATARQPYLFFDGSVRQYTTDQINPGATPLDPSRGGGPWSLSVDLAAQPDFRFVAALLPGDRAVTFSSSGPFTTRMGLRGLDVGGSEVFR